MRKLKLLMVACTLLLGAGQTWAQIDVTSKYLTNASFETGDMTGWSVLCEGNVVEASEDTGVKDATHNTYKFSNSSGDYIFNYFQNAWTWNANLDGIQQVVSGLPAGTYRLTAVLAGWEGWTATLHANSSTQDQVMTGEGNGIPFSVDVTLDGTEDLTIKATMVHINDNVWKKNFIKADNFKLYRLTDVTSTYIANADFNTTPINVAEKKADVGTKGTGSGQENVSYTPTSWTLKTYNDNCLGATVPYGFSHKMNGATVPSKDHSNGEEGAFLFLSVGWGGTIEFTTNEVTLSPGIYTLSYYAYNANTNTGMKSRLGFIPTSGSETISSKNSFAASQWVQDQVTLTITENTAGKFCIGASTSGAASGSKGSGNYAKIFIDGISLEYMPFAEAADYTELSTAISTVEAYTLGFDAGEYASYNVLPILNAAKAIDQGANNSLATVRELIDALNAITPNATEVNAIFDGSFEHDYSGIAGNVQPLGWYRVKNNASDGYNVRYMTKATNAGVDYTSSDCALFTKLQAYYGWDADYTMPLKANTYYTISFLAGGAGDCEDKTDYIKITNPSDETTQIHSFEVPNATANTDASSESWISVSATFRTGAAGNYVLGLVPRNNGNKTQNQFLYGDITLVRATAAEIKPFLSAEITAANDIYNSGANVGTGVFQVPTAAGDDFNTAINTTAQGVYDNASATVAEVTTAIDNLKAAEETYANATVNGPASGVQYRIKSTAAVGAAWKDLYYVLKKDAGQANGGYSTRAEKDDAAFWATAWKFTSVSGNTYKLSMIDADGNERYLCTNITGYGEGSATQIRTTTDDSKALVVKIIAATGTDGRWFLQNTEDNSYIGGQDAGLFSNSQNYDLAIEAAEKASVNVSIDEAVKYGTRIFPFTPTLPSGVTVYSCEAASESTLTLAEVATPQANTPYILEATSGCETDLEGWGTASADNYTAGWLTGVYTSRDAINGTYVLQNNGGKVGFYKVDTSDVIPKVGAYRCYLSVPSGARPAFFFGDETTGIDAINALTSGSATIYSVDGHKLPALQKGLNIIKTDGKTYKVMVK